MTEVGLTNIDVEIINNIIKEENLPNNNLSMKQLLFLFHKYKQVRQGVYKKSVNTKKKVFTQFVEYCLRRNLANYDTLILVTADKGTGKSSTAIQMARAWCRLIGIRFNPKRHIAYTNEDMMRAIKTLNKFEPLIADEAIRFATSEDWNKSENKELKKVLGQVRTKHLFYIMCFPLKVSKLEKTYLNSYVDYWIDLYDRGIGALYIKDKNPSTDVWNLKKFEKLGSWNEFTPSKIIETSLKKHPNFWQVLQVPKLHKSIYDKYLTVRESNVYDDKNVLDAMTKDDFYKAALLLTLKDIITRDGSLSFQRVTKSIERIYGIDIPKTNLQLIMKDAEMLIKRTNEKGGLK